MILPDRYWFLFLDEEAPAQLWTDALFIKRDIKPIIMNLVHECVWFAVKHPLFDRLL